MKASKQIMLFLIVENKLNKTQTIQWTSLSQPVKPSIDGLIFNQNKNNQTDDDFHAVNMRRMLESTSGCVVFYLPSPGFCLHLLSSKLRRKS